MDIAMVITRNIDWIRKYGGKAFQNKCDLSFLLQEAEWRYSFQFVGVWIYLFIWCCISYLQSLCFNQIVMGNYKGKEKQYIQLINVL